MLTLPVVTDAPTVEAPKHSILSVAETPSATDERWLGGVKFTPVNCNTGSVTAVECPPPVPSADIECDAATEITAFNLEMVFNWSTADLAMEPVMLAEKTLDQGTARLIERALWTGETLDPANAAATVTDADIHALSGATSLGTAADAKTALGTVLAALADSTRTTGGTGTIYVNSGIAVELASQNLLCEDGDTLCTLVGDHKVVVGDFPDDAIVAHLGLPRIFLSKVNVVDFTARAQNEVIIRADRAVLVEYDVCSAVIVTVGVGS